MNEREIVMYIEKELEKITRNISSKELLDEILKDYMDEMNKEKLEISEISYQQSKQYLDAVLTDKQKKDLEMMESLFAENMQYSIGFGFKKGLYSGFEQFYVNTSTKEPFNRFIHEEILTMPNMKKYREYYDRLTEINKLFDNVMNELESKDKEYVTTIYCSCDEKNFGVLRYAFYLGYRYALSIIGDVKPLDIGKIVDKILCTEHELAFTMTFEERECWKCSHLVEE